MNILEELERGVTTRTAEETIQCARSLAKVLPPDTILTLSGDLGAGKTTFVKGLAQAWDIAATITSPTYNIFTLHQGPECQLAHMDAYRLDGGDSVESLMLEDFLRSPYCLVIEWPEKIADWIPTDALNLKFTIAHGDQRTIRLRGTESMESVRAGTTPSG